MDMLVSRWRHIAWCTPVTTKLSPRGVSPVYYANVTGVYVYAHRCTVGVHTSVCNTRTWYDDIKPKTALDAHAYTDIGWTYWCHVGGILLGVHRLALSYPLVVYRRCIMPIPRVYMYMHTGVP
jgi:hypothetical protein